MSRDEFTKLFAYIQDFRRDFDKHVEQSGREHAEIMGTVVEFAVQVKEQEDTVVILGHQVERQERWLKKIAHKTKAPLEQ